MLLGRQYVVEERVCARIFTSKVSFPENPGEEEREQEQHECTAAPSHWHTLTKVSLQRRSADSKPGPEDWKNTEVNPRPIGALRQVSSQ